MYRTPIAARVLVVFVATSLAACGTEPHGPVLDGQFGGRLAAVSAEPSGAQMRFPCAAAKTGPLALDGDRVTASGMYYPGWPMGQSWALTTEGVLRGDTLTLTATVVSDHGTFTDTYVLYRSATPDFSGIACLLTR